MTVDRETLQAANCWFNVDRVPDQQMTAFKREARYRQAQWRDRRGYGAGTHRNSKRAIAAGGPETIANGTRLDDPNREQGVNFLSDRIRDAVRDRLDTPQEHQMLNVDRLMGDLLSSMPMCFNLFGELHGDPERASRAASLLLPSATDGPVDVVFEWSPRRRSTQFTNDRTAFDAALRVGDDAPRQVVGIETKYHEHATPEKKPKLKQLDRFEQQREWYTGIARRSQMFKPGWESQILGTELEQIWRDHLLLLSMLEHPEQWSGGRYVLVYPSRNVSFAQAAAAYRGSLVDHDTTFAALTLGELVDAGVLHEPQTAARFKDRYIW